MGKNEENFEELFEKSVKKVNLDKFVTGRIIEITSKGEIFVDLGYKADGIIPKNEYSDNYDDNPKNEFKEGDMITAEVLKMNDGYGNVLLSYKKAKSAKVLEEIKEKYNNSEKIEGKVSNVSSKGLNISYNGINIFIPLSLSGITKNEKVEDYINRNVKFKIVELDIRKKRIIGSIKDILDKEKRDNEKKFWNEIEIGKKYEGKVTNITSYGAFVDLGVIQGLLHISEMTWNKNAKPEDFVKVGEKIEVKIKSFDIENKKVELASDMKGEDPWKKVSEVYKVTDVVNVEVVKITKFGAFVKLEEGIEGLIHISQISLDRVTDVSKILKVGQKLNAKIIDIDLDKKKIELSIKDLIGTKYETVSDEINE